MSTPSRRRFVAGTFTIGAALAGAGLPRDPAAAVAPHANQGPGAPSAADIAPGDPGHADILPGDPGHADILPGDPGYEELATRGLNKRFTARPPAFRVAATTAQVVRAVGEAARLGRRVAVRSGGHCYENFVGDPAVGLVIDVGEMNAVSYDPHRRAFMVEAGARLMDVYRTLHDSWGVTLPGGASATVGFGGHIAGGGYGALSRRFGVAADHLHAVEVVVADSSGRARAVIATREPWDPHRELWWAHTGGGGGNFGAVTRYWFRSPGATGDDPTALLPRPPAEILSHAVTYPREGMDRAALRRLVTNFGRWHERNSDPGSPYAGLYGGLVLLGRLAANDPGESAVSFTQLDATDPGAERLLDRYVAAVTEGVGVTPRVTGAARDPWLTATRTLAASQDADKGRQKIKSAYLRRAPAPHQIDALYMHLARGAGETRNVSLQSYGGRVNSVPSGATATAHRNAVVNVIFTSTWQDPAADAGSVGRLRRLYRDVFATTGGVPVPGRGGGGDGCYINYPDLDMANPEWNTSGMPWHRLYYRDNYARLQRVKAVWDPLGVFGHALGVRPD